MKYVVYYRVSTKTQENSGLGLEAQKTAVENYLRNHRADEVPPSFTEIESGKKSDRPELMKAIERCKEVGATLLIAKLDRLSRNVVFILNLREELQAAGVGFKALDLPDANTLTLTIMAAMAQQEREFISERTKAGLQAKRLREPEWKPGKPENLTDEARQKAHASVSRKAREDRGVRFAYHFITPRREKGLSYQKIAEELNKEGYKTRQGRKFHAQQVYNIWKRFESDRIKTKPS